MEKLTDYATELAGKTFLKHEVYTPLPVTCLHRNFNCERNHLCHDDHVLLRILEQQQDKICSAVDTIKYSKIVKKSLQKNPPKKK